MKQFSPLRRWLAALCCSILACGLAVAQVFPASLLSRKIPNLIGVHLLLPIARSETACSVAFSKRMDAGAAVKQADAADREHHS